MGTRVVWRKIRDLGATLAFWRAVRHADAITREVRERFSEMSANVAAT